MMETQTGVRRDKARQKDNSKGSFFLDCFHVHTTDIVFLFKFRRPYQSDPDQMRAGGFVGGLDSASPTPLMG